MGFRIHRGIFQKLNAERTAYENTFKIDDDGRIKEVDSEGNVTFGYLKVGEQASDADTVDGIHAGSFLRSDASDTYTGGNLVINSSGQYRVFHAKATRAAGLGTGSAGSNTPPFLFENTGGDQAWGVVAEFRINEDNRGGDSPAILFSDAQQSTQWTVGFDYTGSEFGIRKNRGIYSGGWGTSYFKINTSGKVFIPGELEVDSRIYADNGVHVRGDWLRVDGSNGIYFESYGGGWRMSDTSWIRAYNDKNIYTGGNIEVGGTIRANGNGFYVDSTNVINSEGKFIGNIDNSETKSDYFIQEAHGNPRNNLGSPTVTEMALFDSQFRCMTDLSNNYTNLDRLTFWVQQNEGDEWTEVTHSDTNKKRFLRTNSSGVVIPNRAYKFRVEFKAPGYVFANALYFYWSSNSHSTKVHVYKYNASQDTWHAHATSNTNVSSWPGHLYLPFSTIPWHETHTTSTGHHRYIRVEFIPNWSTGSYADRDINLYGGQIWGGYPSGRRTVHSINEDGNYYFPANLYAEGGSGDGNRLATRDWVGSNTLNQTEGDARYLGISAKAADSNLLDGIDSGSFLRSDAEDTKSNNTMFTGPVWIDDSGRLGTSKYRWTNSALTTTSIEIVDDNGDNAGTCATLALHNYGDGGVQMRMGNTGDKWLYLSSAKSNGAGTTTDDNSERYFVGMKINNNTVWHAGNLTNVSQLTNDSSFATTSYVDTAVSNLVDSAPGALNTLNELAAALGDDANFSTTVTNAIAAKANSSHTHGIGDINDAPRWWNNFGDNHTTRTSFDAENNALTTGFGWRYVQGSTNGPGTSTSPNQYYALTVGLGNDYNYDNYGMQLVIPRNTATPYISVRFEENRSLGAWQKISAGYADTAGSANAVAWANVSGKPSTFAPSSHNHDGRYYTESEIDTKLATKAPTNHTHLFIKPYQEYGSYIRSTDTPNTLQSNMGGGGLRVDFMNGASFNTWSHVITWSGYNGYNMYQLAGNYGGSGGAGPELYVRTEPNHARSSWSDWRKLWHDGHFSSTDISNWNTAHGWGNHAGLYAAASHTHSYNDLTDKPTIPSNNNQLTNGAGYITGSGNTSGYAGQLSDRGGYGNNSFSFNQESGTFAGYTGWANYFIGNHGDGATYYNTVHIMPFWGVPQYSRLEGGTFRGPWTYWTTENMSQATVNTWNTAYGWGNHATQGYLTSVPSEYLTTTDNDGRYILKSGGGVITKNATDVGASAYHLELYSNDTSDATKQVSIRFHQGGRYWGQIRYNNDGFRFTEGSSNNLVTVKGRFVGDLVGQASTAGSVNWNNVDNKPSTFTPSNHAASKVTSGTFANARISQSSVTQHQGALSIAASQVTGLTTTPPVTTSATGAEASTLASIDFNTDENIATFTLADGSTYTLQMLRPR